MCRPLYECEWVGNDVDDGDDDDDIDSVSWVTTTLFIMAIALVYGACADTVGKLSRRLFAVADDLEILSLLLLLLLLLENAVPCRFFSFQLLCCGCFTNNNRLR